MRYNALVAIALLSSTAYAVPSIADSEVSEPICPATGECYPSVFEATNDFQVVREGQSIPVGLHVKMNLETGLKEAQLLAPHEEQQSEDSSSDLALVPGETAKEDGNTKSEIPPKPYPPTAPVYSTDIATFDKALNTLAESSTCTQESQEALDALEELAHELEFGLRLVDSKKTKGFEVILHLLQSVDPDCRSKAALVLGSALRNNDNALAALPKDFPVVDQLLQLLKVETVSEVQNMLVYALSAIMPEKTSISSFLESDGHETLLASYSNGTLALKGRIASFVEDHFAQLPVSASKIIVQDRSAYESRIVETDILGRWCDTFQGSLMEATDQNAAKEKLLSSISQIRRMNTDVCTTSQPFLNYLAKEARSKRSYDDDPVPEMALAARSLFGNSKASRKHHADFL